MMTVLAKKHTAKRLGSIPACVALAAADIGTCELETGETVYVTWGRNLDREQQSWFAKHTHFRAVWLSADDGSAELILPNEMVAHLLPILTF